MQDLNNNNMYENVPSTPPQYVNINQNSAVPPFDGGEYAYNQQNVYASQPAQAVKKPKKNHGCLTVFLVFIGIILLLIGTVFGVRLFKQYQRQKYGPQRFATVQYSATDKLKTALNNGEISPDTYIQQLLYSQYNQTMLDAAYTSDYQDLAPVDIIAEAEIYYDQLSEETKKSLVDEIMLSGYRIGPEANEEQLTGAQAASVGIAGALGQLAYADDVEYNTLTLNRVKLSDNGRFLIWYAADGSQAVSEEVVNNLATDLESKANALSAESGIDWSYSPKRRDDSLSYGNAMAMLIENDIPTSALKDAIPVYLLESATPNGDTSALAWYTSSPSFLDGLILELGGLFIDSEYYTAYCTPYIVIRPSQLTVSEDNSKAIYTHELFHHFQSCYSDDIQCGGFTKETTANLFAALVVDAARTDTVINDHGENYIAFAHESVEAKQYSAYIFANSYYTQVQNGREKLLESLNYSNAYEFLYSNAGTDYKTVMLNLARLNLTKDYSHNLMVTASLPAPAATLGAQYDKQILTVPHSAIHYFYFNAQDYKKYGSSIYLGSSYTEDAGLSYIVFGNKNGNFTALQTGSLSGEISIDTTEEQYKQYGEIVIAVVNWAYTDDLSYYIGTISDDLLNLYEAGEELENFDFSCVSGDYIEFYVKDFFSAIRSVIKAVTSLNNVIDENLDTADPDQAIISQALGEYNGQMQQADQNITDLQSEIPDSTLVRIYSLKPPVGLNDAQMHEQALNVLSGIKFKLFDTTQDGMHVSAGIGINPLGPVQIYAMATTQNGTAEFYKIEIEK